MSHAALLVAALLSLGSNSRPQVLAVQNQRADKDPAKHVGDITGYYSCQGEDANGKKYSGVCTIIKKNDIYVVQWTVGFGSTFMGIGIRKGDNFAVSWAMADEKKLVRGVNLYKIDPGPRLSGNWATLPGDGFLQRETLTFLKRLDD